MTISIVTGNAISSLTESVLKDVRNCSRLWPDRRGLIIVPEYRKLSVERQYLAMKDTGHLMMSEVLSFNRLAFRLLDELGVMTKATLGTEGAAMLLRRILFDHRQELRYFGTARQNRRFLLELERIIGELRRFGVTAERLEGLDPPHETMKRKFADVAVIMRAWEEALAAQNLTDGQSGLQLLCTSLDRCFDSRGVCVREPAPLRRLSKRLSWLNRTRIWVTGFGEDRNFTPLEFEILKRLGKIAESLTITVVQTAGEAEQVLPEDAAGRRTLQSLTTLFPQAAQHRLPPAPTLPHPLAQASEEEQGIRLVECEEPLAALQWTAGTIARLTMAGTHRYRDFAVVIANRTDYLPELKAVFEQAGIPLFLDEPRLLTHLPVGRLLVGALDLALNGWNTDTVMYFLRCGLFDVSPEQLDRFENFCLEHGLERQYLFEDERFLIHDREGSHFYEDELDLRRNLLDPVRRFTDELKGAQTCAFFCSRLLRLLAELNCAERSEVLAEHLQSAGLLSEAAEVIRSWNGLLALVEQLAEICDEEPLDLSSFRQIIISGLDHADAALIPTALDQVMVGPAARVLGGKPRVLFILGAEAAHFPSGDLDEGLFKDPDRAYLSEAFQLDFPSVYRQKPDTDRFLIAQLLRLPSEQLILMWQKDADYAPAVARLIRRRRVEIVPKQPTGPDDVRFYSPAVARQFLFSAGERPNRLFTADPEAWRAVIERTRAADVVAFDLGLQKLQLPHEIGRRELQVSKEQVTALLGPDVRAGTTALETYAGCAYAYFVNYLLGARERKVFTLQYAEFGTFLHKIMETAFAEVQAEPDLRNRILNDAPWYERWLADVIARSIEEADFSQVFARPENRSSLLRQAGRIAQCSLRGQIAESLHQQRLPLELEWRFSPENGNALKISTPELDLLLSGVVDRVDRAADKPDGYAVIDYKTFNKTVNNELLWYGLDLQLPLYLLAWQNAHPEQQPTGAGYRNLVLQTVHKHPDQAGAGEGALKAADIKLPPEAFRYLMQHSLQYARDYLTRLGAGCFPVNPATPDEQAFDPCRYCRSKGICGIEKQRIEGPVYATFEQLVQQHRGKEAAAAARKIKKNDRLAYLLMQTYGPGHAEGTSEGEEADHEVYG